MIIWDNWTVAVPSMTIAVIDCYMGFDIVSAIRRQLLLFVCLWIFGHPRIFTYIETLLLPVKGCKFWPMLGTRGHWAEGSLTCHNHCDTGLPFIMVISADPLHSHLLQSVWQWSRHYLFTTYGLSRPGLGTLLGKKPQMKWILDKIDMFIS